MRLCVSLGNGIVLTKHYPFAVEENCTRDFDHFDNITSKLWVEIYTK